MSEPQTLPHLVPSLLELLHEAGQATLRYWRGELEVERKADDSPVTAADRASNALLLDGLARLTPGLPVLSEEGRLWPYEQRKDWQSYWIVDPLDGTRDFVAGRDEYAVLLARIESGRPVLGLIHAPARGVSYYGGPGLGAFKMTPEGPRPIHTNKHSGPDGPVVLHSRSHRTPKLDAYLQDLPHSRVPMGSGLKFGLLAEGVGQLYPCLHPTYEWDTAAGQALLEGAGGELVDLEGRPLGYNKPELLNPSFLAKA